MISFQESAEKEKPLWLTPNMTEAQNIFSGLIRRWQRGIDDLNKQINFLAKTHVPDFSILDHKVSTLWDCELSPIGMCVYNLKDGTFNINCRCRYCNNPVERK